MKRTFFLFLLLITLTSSTAISQWEKITIPGNNQTVMKIKILDKNNFQMITTTKFFGSYDHGNNWISSTLPNSVVYGLNSRNTDTVYIAGNNYNLNLGFFAKSIDKGSKWNIYSFDTKVMPASLISDISLTSNNKLFVCGDFDVIYYSTDDGTTWNKSWQGKTKRSFRSLSFGDSSNGYVLSSSDNGVAMNKIVFRTTDGGNTWDSVHIFPDAAIRRLQAVGSKIVYVAGQDSLYEAVYKTIDGGKSWQKVWKGLMRNTGIWSMYFVNEKLGFIGAEEGAVYRTRDGGYTWNAIPTGASAGINEVSFINDYFGFCVGGVNVYNWDNSSKVPVIAVNVSELNFGSVDTGKTKKLKIEISNSGKLNLEISEIKFEYSGTDSNGYSISAKLPIVLIPDGINFLDVSFSPKKIDLYPADMILVSNDPNKPELRVHLTGMGYPVTDVGNLDLNGETIIITAEQLLLTDNEKGILRTTDIYDLSGRAIYYDYSGNNYIDISSFPIGIYFLRIGASFYKFVKTTR